MWQQVRATDDVLLGRCLELARLGDPREQEGPWKERLAEVRYGVFTGQDERWLYPGTGFDASAHFRFNPKRQRHMVCFGIEGSVSAARALDLFYQRALAYADARGLDDLYGLEPRELVSGLLTEVYVLAEQHPSFEKTVVAEMADLRLIRLRRRIVASLAGAAGVRGGEPVILAR